MVVDGPPSLPFVLCMSCCWCIVVCRRECGLGCGRLTAGAPPVRPPLVADPLGGSAKPQYGISKNLMSGINGLPFLHALNFY